MGWVVSGGSAVGGEEVEVRGVEEVVRGVEEEVVRPSQVTREVEGSGT